VRALPLRTLPRANERRPTPVAIIEPSASELPSASDAARASSRRAGCDAIPASRSTDCLDGSLDDVGEGRGGTLLHSRGDVHADG
jgi:hypothetical protein